MESVPSNQGEALTILTMPDYRDINPYQELLSRALSERNVHVLFTNGYRRVFPLYRQVKALEHCDVLHLHWIDPYVKGKNWLSKFIYCLKFLLDIYLVKLGEVKVVWTIHNLTSHNAKFPGLEKWTKQLFLRFVDHVIVHSESAKESVVQAYQLDNGKVSVVPHGHYRDVYLPAITQTEARKQLGLKPNGLLFLNFGMLRPYKGIEKLLAIWHDHHQDLAETQLLIAGKALDLDYGKELAEQAAHAKNIQLNDKFVDNEKIHLYFSAADIVALPFNQILTSGSLLLAMSYGKPIIAPRSPSIEETLHGATDFLYDPENQSGLLQAIQDSIKSDSALLSQKVSIACDRLNWSDIALETKKIYQL